MSNLENVNEVFIGKSEVKELDLINPHNEKELTCNILELQAEFDAIETELKAKKDKLREMMIGAGIKTIKTYYGTTIAVAERNADKIDQNKCRMFLDNQGIYEEFSKIDDAKVKKVYPTAEFVIQNPPTFYLVIKGAK